ncbi:hypothetical protein HOY82DRAFT_93916 [Tuber indicum]|nr:hypothetical protein HOY82DRAFT_93916 [Tuber indicum]
MPDSYVIIQCRCNVRAVSYRTLTDRPPYLVSKNEPTVSIIGNTRVLFSMQAKKNRHQTHADTKTSPQSRPYPSPHHGGYPPGSNENPAGASGRQPRGAQTTLTMLKYPYNHQLSPTNIRPLTSTIPSPMYPSRRRIYPLHPTPPNRDSRSEKISKGLAGLCCRLCQLLRLRPLGAFGWLVTTGKGMYEYEYSTRLSCTRVCCGSVETEPFYSLTLPAERKTGEEKQHHHVMTSNYRHGIRRANFYG